MRQYVWCKAPFCAALITINHLHYDAYFNIARQLLSYLGYSHNEARAGIHVSKKVIYTHTEKFYSIPWLCSMNFNNFYLTLLFRHQSWEDRIKKRKREGITSTNAVYTNDSAWIHPLAWKNKSLQNDHFSINVWKYLLPGATNQQWDTRLWCARSKGPSVKVNFPGSPLSTVPGTFSWKVWKSDFLKWISNSLWRGEGSINLC